MNMPESLGEYKKYVKRRLEPISDIIANIALGDFSKRLEIPSEDDEFTELYVGLDFMMEDLLEHLNERREAENELRKHQEHLEELIEERTVELKEINEKLKQEVIEHEQAKMEIMANEEKFRMIYENMSDVIYSVDLSQILKDITPSVERFSGYKPDELIGKRFDELNFLTKESLKNTYKNLKRVISNDPPTSTEYEFITKNGSKKIAEVVSTPIRKDGQIIEIVAVARDITDRKKAEEALKESEEKFRLLFESADEGILYINPDGEILNINPKALEIGGFDREWVVGRNVSELVPLFKSDESVVLDIFDGVIEGKKLEKNEWEITNNIGKDLTIQIYPSLIKKENELLGISIMIEDITERKKAEEQLKESLSEKEVLLREIHHRVKNNIQVITSMLNLHTSYIKDTVYSEMIKEIQNRIRSMALIHEKLYRSKDLAKIDFNEYIKDLVNSLFRFYGVNINKIKPIINAKGSSLDINAGIPCGLIINELVSNSLKHGFKDDMDGQIQIILKQEKDNRTALIIKDNGSGFPKDLDFKNTKTFGLQLVNTLVAQLGGTIELESKDGTEFNILFEHEKLKQEV